MGSPVVRLGNADRELLSRLCIRCSGFFELIEGRPANDATADEILGPLSSEYARRTKHVWGVEENGELIAVAELLQGHPSIHDWYIGLLLIAPEHRGKRLGRRFCAAILDWIAGQNGVMVRLVVQHQNPRARAFWEREGFAIENEVLQQSGRLHGAAFDHGAQRRELTSPGNLGL